MQITTSLIQKKVDIKLSFNLFWLFKWKCQRGENCWRTTSADVCISKEYVWIM